MHQNQIGVITRGGLKGLTGPLSQDVHSYASSLMKAGGICASKPEFSTEVVHARMID